MRSIDAVRGRAPAGKALLTIRSTRVVLPDGERPASIHIDGGVVTRVEEWSATPSGAGRSSLSGLGSGERRPSYGEARRNGEAAKAAVERAPHVVDFGHLVVSPGLVDSHVHVNEPGRTDWEGFDTATRAAAAGGVTTIVDMPLNSVPATTTVDALEEKREAARKRIHVDVGFWGGVVPGNDSHLDPLVDAGVRGFKCFLVPSGVDEFPAVDETDLRRAMPILARRDVPLLVHAESPSRIVPYSIHTGGQVRSTYGFYLATRPPQAEVDAIRLMIRLAGEFGVRTHIVHVAAAEAVTEIAQAKADGVPITAETCPHYLTFAADEIPDGATEFKCAPPIRESHHRAALWKALDEDVLDLVATDHSPAPPELKCQGDFMRAWGGIASLQLSLPAVWSADAERSRDTPLLVRQSSELRRGSPEPLRGGGRTSRPARIARWMSERPAALAALDRRKGRIAVGYDADLIVWDPDAEFVVDPAALQHRHKLTPYAGRRLRGRVTTTFLRGERIWDQNALVRTASGQLL